MSKNALLIAVLAVVVIVVFIAALMYNPVDEQDMTQDQQQEDTMNGDIDGEDQDSEDDVSGDSDAAGTVLAGSSALFVADQMPSNTVTANAVVLAEDGYIVIHEQSDGEVGPIIGRSDLLTAGQYSNVLIELERNTENGETLYAMLHESNGNTTFAADEDTPLRDDQGNVLVMSFLIDVDAEDVGDVTF